MKMTDTDKDTEERSPEPSGFSSIFTERSVALDGQNELIRLST